MKLKANELKKNKKTNIILLNTNITLTNFAIYNKMIL